MLRKSTRFAIDPPVGFHFKVQFESMGKDNDMRFKEVQGISATMEMEAVIEGGQNRFTKQLPKRTKYSDITLKRGLNVDSDILEWCREAIEDFEFKPLDIIISLLDEKHEPLIIWKVINAIPIEWSLSGFNAMESSAVIESIKLNYDYFEIKKGK